MPVQIFFCYAREDELLLNNLKAHLKPLQRQGFIDAWYDRDISAGIEWEREIKKHLDDAQIILLMISPDFMNSEYCYGIELQRATERHERGEARVVPIILRPVDWQVDPLGKLQALPTDAIPVMSRRWHNPDEAFYDIATGIRKIISELASQSSIGNVAPKTKNDFHVSSMDKKVGFEKLTGEARNALAYDQEEASLAAQEPKPFLLTAPVVPDIIEKRPVENALVQSFLVPEEHTKKEYYARSISEYLQQDDVQTRILDHIQQARSKMAVTISRAARLFNFSESQLREWEKRGLLQVERPLLSQDSNGPVGHRQYSLAELSKLAIIRDLIDHGYAAGEIPVDIQRLWGEATGGLIGTFLDQNDASAQFMGENNKTRQMSIEARVEYTDTQGFWCYFVAQALRLSLILICEEMPATIAGLVLPLEERNLAGWLTDPADLKKVGRSLVGWQGQNRSFYLFSTDTPAFDFPTDYRLQTLKQANEQELTRRERVLDNTFLVLARSTRRSQLAPELQETVRRLLELIYQRVATWEPMLGYGTRDWVYQAHDLERTLQGSGDRIFNALLERVIELGGQTTNGRDRWKFCTLLLPDDPNLPMQQQSLIVRAQTRQSPYQIGLTRINPQDTVQANSITIKAFEGGQIISIPAALPGDSMLSPQQVHVITSTPEMIARGQPGKLFQAPPSGEKLHSALVMPVAGEFGISSAVFYIESNEVNAFSSADQRVLRIISRMLDELLMTSRAPNQGLTNRATILGSPAFVDSTFRDFAVETDFIAEIDKLLASIQKEGITGAQEREEISILSVDIDNLSSLAMKYGNRIARNLSLQVGLRIRGRSNSAGNFRVFHISADKYYILLESVDLAGARSLAKQLHDVLSVKEYRIPPLSARSGHAILPESMLELSGITAHIGVSSYTLGKLDELLKRYAADTAIIYVRTLILAGIDDMLERGKLAGGNCVVAWDRAGWRYEVLL